MRVRFYWLINGEKQGVTIDAPDGTSREELEQTVKKLLGSSDIPYWTEEEEKAKQ